MKKLFVANRETGDFIEEIASIEEGKQIIAQYEENDKKDDIYEPNFYDIVDEDHSSVL